MSSQWRCLIVTDNPIDRVLVSVSAQSLALCTGDNVVVTYPVSTAAAGTGQQSGSWQTPLGEHRVRVKVGHGAPHGAVFVRRRATGEVWSEALHTQCPERDWVLSRILWLTGREPGVNRGGDVDSLRRFIYIHGTPDCEPMGQPLSHGCIRMTNDDVIDMFERVPVGTPVLIAD